MAQNTTSTIYGTVTDGSGASIVGAAVTVTNAATGIVYHANSDAIGNYRIAQLPPGSYTMKVTNSGFKTQEIAAFPLVVDQQFQQNIALSVGDAVQTISVSTSALLLDTENNNQGQVIENQQINDMPLNGRDYLQLAQLSAGVTPIVSGMSSPASGWTGPQTVAIVIGGLREDDVSYLYDGIETRNAWYGAAGLLPSPDNIQEFKVEQSGSSAQFGDGGAFVSVVTKSGTNRLHGTAYEYVRNNDFDARNYFDTSAPPAFHQNQFGAAAGGPIRKNKMFFFGNYEGFRQIQPNDEYNRVPTDQQRAGDFSSLTTQLVDPLNGYKPIKDNQITTAMQNSIGMKILNLFPRANGSYVNGNNYFDVADTINNSDQYSGRFDYAVSKRDNVFVRYTQQKQTITEGSVTQWRKIIYPSDPKNLAVGWNHTINDHILNSFRYGWSHTAVGEQRADGYNQAYANPLGMLNEGDQPGSYGPPSFGITGYVNPGSTEGTDIVREGLNMFTDTVMIQKGKHQISAGLDIRYEPIYMYEDWAATSISFNGTYSGDPVADLLLGVPVSSFTAIGDPTLNLRKWYQAYFVQDNMQVNHHLTVTAGLRYEHQRQPIDLANHVGSFDVATGTDLTYPDTSVLGLGRNMVKPRYANFAPRLGFNWMPDNNGKWDVKGGFGLYYLQPNVNQYEVEVDSSKLYLIKGYNNSNGSTQQTPFFTLSQMFTPNLNGGLPTDSFIDPNAKTAYTYEWNLSADRTFGNWLVELAYLASSARHYEERPNIDPIRADGSYPFPKYSGVQENTESGSSTYNGMIVRVEKRFSSGFSAMGSYTWSKCLGMPWQDVFSWHPLDMHLDRGHCQEDMNHNLVANSIYELPFGAGKPWLNHGVLTNAVMGGWKVAAIAALHSGPWETLGSSQDLGMFVNSLPNITGAVNNSSLHGGLGKNGKLGPYFNVGNVTPLTTLGVQGNAGVQNISTPGAATWDLSGYKGWKFGEQAGLTFRADAFNAFNRVNFTGLDTSSTDAVGKFGYLTGAGAARELQLSLRLDF